MSLKLLLSCLDIALNSDDFLLILSFIPSFLDDRLHNSLISDWIHRELHPPSPSSEQHIKPIHVQSQSFSFSVMKSRSKFSFDLNVTSVMINDVQYCYLQAHDTLSPISGHQNSITLHFVDIPLENRSLEQQTNSVAINIMNSNILYHHEWVLEWISPIFFSSRLPTENASTHPVIEFV